MTDTAICHGCPWAVAVHGASGRWGALVPIACRFNAFQFPIPLDHVASCPELARAARHAEREGDPPDDLR